MPNPLNDLVPDNPLSEYASEDPLMFTEHAGKEIRATPSSTWLDVLDFVSGKPDKEYNILQKSTQPVAEFLLGATADNAKKARLGIPVSTFDYILSAMEVGGMALPGLTWLMKQGSGKIAGGIAKSQKGIIGSEFFSATDDMGGWPTRDAFFGEIGKDLPDNVQPLGTALDLAREGKDAEHIFKKTGWWFDDNNAVWRFEINDNPSKLNYTIKEYLLGNKNEYSAALPDVLKHPELYKTYPFLKYVTVNFKNVPGSATRGAWNESELAITINKSAWGSVGNNIEYIGTKIKGTLLHEIQHAIQSYDNLLNGGNVDSILSLGKHDNLSETDAFNIYSRLFGEAEARAVTYRASSDSTVRFLERQIARKLEAIKKLEAEKAKSKWPKEVQKVIDTETANLISARKELDHFINAVPHDSIQFLIESPIEKQDLIPISGKNLTKTDVTTSNKNLSSTPPEGPELPPEVMAIMAAAGVGGAVSGKVGAMSTEDKQKLFQDFLNIIKVDDGIYQGQDDVIYEVSNGKIKEWSP